MFKNLSGNIYVCSDSFQENYISLPPSNSVWPVSVSVFTPLVSKEVANVALVLEVPNLREDNF